MITIHLDKYCVYTHSINGDIFYVGQGLSDRPFDHRSRNNAWKAITAGVGAGAIDVEIVDWYETAAEALEVEKNLISTLRPVANVGGGGNLGFKSLVRRGSTRVACLRNIARLTNYGNFDDREWFRDTLRRHLRIPDVCAETWQIPDDWARAYDDYFAAPDPEYAARKDWVPEISGGTENERRAIKRHRKRKKRFMRLIKNRK